MITANYLMMILEENKKLKEQLRKSKSFKKGDVVYVQMERQKPETSSTEQYSRPYIVVSNNTGNYYSDIILGVPLTGKTKEIKQPTQFRISYRDSVALCEQIKTLDQNKIQAEVSYHLTDYEMGEINKCLKISLALD
jgi:mRNA-degrading endonuclease toxin of MazEF toxin-antitoxin module